jgi:hypothetical protein
MFLNEMALLLISNYETTKRYEYHGMCTVGKHKIYLHIKHYMRSSNGALVAAITPKATEGMTIASMSLFYILHTITLT